MGQGLEGWIFDPSKLREHLEELLQGRLAHSHSAGGPSAEEWKGAWARQLLSFWGS